MRKILFLVIGLMAVTTIAHAEIIHMKDGRIIDEKIIERGRYYIVTMKGQIPQKYYLGEIDFIEEDGSATQASTYDDIDMSKFPGLDKDKVKLILIMIDVSGVRQTMQTNIDNVLQNVSDEKKDMFRQLFNVDDIIDRIVPVYNKYYANEELISVIEFYESSAGKKVLEVTPKIMQETIQETSKYFQDKIAQ